jgi:hypothetical protein
MQGAFLSSPLIPYSGRLVESVSEEGDETGDEVERKKSRRETTDDHGDNDKSQKENGKYRRDVAPSRSRGRSRFLADERNGVRLPPALTIDFDFVGYEFISFRSALAIGKGADMYEDWLATAIGRDEAEAFVILPCGDTTLIAHGKREQEGGYGVADCEFAGFSASMRYVRTNPASRYVCKFKVFMFFEFY